MLRASPADFLFKNDMALLIHIKACYPAEFLDIDHSRALPILNPSLSKSPAAVFFLASFLSSLSSLSSGLRLHDIIFSSVLQTSSG